MFQASGNLYDEHRPFRDVLYTVTNCFFASHLSSRLFLTVTNPFLFRNPIEQFSHEKPGWLACNWGLTTSCGRNYSHHKDPKLNQLKALDDRKYPMLSTKALVSWKATHPAASASDFGQYWPQKDFFWNIFWIVGYLL